MVIGFEFDAALGSHFTAKPLMPLLEPGSDDLGEPMLACPPLHAVCRGVQVKELVLHRIACGDRQRRTPNSSVLLGMKYRIPQQRAVRCRVRIRRPENAGLYGIRPIAESITLRPITRGIERVCPVSSRWCEAWGPAGVCTQDTVDAGKIVGSVEVDQLVHSAGKSHGEPGDLVPRDRVTHEGCPRQPQAVHDHTNVRRQGVEHIAGAVGMGGCTVSPTGEGDHAEAIGETGSNVVVNVPRFAQPGQQHQSRPIASPVDHLEPHSTVSRTRHGNKADASG